MFGSGRTACFKSYPYKVNDGREDERASGARVLRGGSFDGNEGSAALCLPLHQRRPRALGVFVWWRPLFSPERF